MIIILSALSAAAGCAHFPEVTESPVTQLDDGDYVNVAHGELISPSLIVRDTREHSDKDLLLIGLHGYGMDERQIATLVNVDPDAPHVYLAPRGFIALEDGSRAWFDVRFEEDGIAVGHVDRRRFLDRLMGYLHASSEFFGFDRDRISVIGYSQGAAGAIDLAISHPKCAAAFVGLAGVVLDPSPPAHPTSYQNSALFIGHGLQDAAVSTATMRRHVDQLEIAGMRILYREYDVPHVVSAAQRRDVSDWITQRFAVDASDAEACGDAGDSTLDTIGQLHIRSVNDEPR